MVLVRVTTLLLLLLFLIQSLSAFSSVNAHQEKEETLKIVLGGRKMGAGEEDPRKEIAMEGGEKASKISGKGKDASNTKKIQDQDINQISQTLSEVSLEDHKRVGGEERLLSSAKELAYLMHKDYVGMNKPRRKPPVNNNEPQH